MAQPSPSLSPTVSGKDDKQTFNVNTDVANNQYLAGDLTNLNNQSSKISNQRAAQTNGARANTPSASLVAMAHTPQASAVANSSNVNVNQQGFNAQAENLKQLQAQSQGQGPAAQAVQMQTQQATNQGLNAQLAMAGSMRGGNAGEALRQASVGQAQVTGQAANQAAMNTLQSEQQGITNAGTVAGAMQGESLQSAQQQQQNQQFNAGATNTQGLQSQQLQQQTALANQQSTNAQGLQTQQLQQQTALANQQSTNTANLANQQANNQWQTQQDQMISQLQASGMSIEQAQEQANISMAEYATGSAADQYAAQQGHAISQQNADTSSANAAISGISTAADVGTKIAEAASDKRVKKDIKKGDKETSDFLSHLSAKSWNYKDPDKHGIGRHLGVMAQDLEKSKLGRDMVSEGDDGVKMVNYGGAKGMAAIVASMAYLNEKLKKLEEVKGKK